MSFTTNLFVLVAEPPIRIRRIILRPNYCHLLILHFRSFPQRRTNSAHLVTIHWQLFKVARASVFRQSVSIQNKKWQQHVNNELLFLKDTIYPWSTTNQVPAMLHIGYAARIHGYFFNNCKQQLRELCEERFTVSHILLTYTTHISEIHHPSWFYSTRREYELSIIRFISKNKPNYKKYTSLFFWKSVKACNFCFLTHRSIKNMYFW